ncbi:MAG: PAS domain-containing protein [Oscillospiraceae bacterium]|jgi:two-component system phosphate regulon sensor histidine kinase PhoR|nr:PAS domain-containing protein [Oscillospiraceae bacterium]
MKKRITRLFCLVAGISIVLIAAIMQIFVCRYLTDSMHSETAHIAEYVCRGVQSGGLPYLESIADMRGGERITLIDADGVVLFDNQADAADMENHLSRAEVQSAIADGIGESTRYSGTLLRQTYYYAILMPDGSILRAASSSGSVLSALTGTIIVSFLIVLVVFVIATALSARISNKIFEPINRIDLNNPDSGGIYDELAPFMSRIKAQNKIIGEQIAEAERKKREFGTIADNMKEGLIVLDNGGGILTCNKTAYQLLETTPAEDMRGHSILELRRDAAFQSAVAEALEGSARENAFSLNGKHLRVFINPIADGSIIVGATIIILDVTEYEDRERLRREFSASVSHELKTPLMSISGYAEIMSGGIVKTKDMRGFSNKIYLESQRMISLVNDIIMLSKLDESGSELAKETVDLFELTRYVVERIEQAAAAKHISIAFSGERAEIAGVPYVLDQMVFNLLDNAVKYNSENGKVDVSVKNEGVAVILTIEDTGIGIPENERERIFERFYRVDKSRGLVAGTGLGLSIVKHGATLHNAKISVDSIRPSGTRFAVRFDAVGT